KGGWKAQGPASPGRMSPEIQTKLHEPARASVRREGRGGNLGPLYVGVPPLPNPPPRGGREFRKDQMEGVRPGFAGPIESLIQARLHEPARASVRREGRGGEPGSPERGGPPLPNPPPRGGREFRKDQMEGVRPGFAGPIESLIQARLQEPARASVRKAGPW